MALIVTGQAGTREYRAAHELADRIREVWPWVESDPETDLRLATQFQGPPASGVGEIDIVLFGIFGPQAVYTPRDGDGSLPPQVERLQVADLVIVIEVKDPDENSWRMRGGNIEVFYREAQEWKSASGQNINQLHVLKQHFERRTKQSPYIYKAVWLRSIPDEQLKDLAPTQVMVWGGDTSWGSMLGMIAHLMKRSPRQGLLEVACYRQDQRHLRQVHAEAVSGIIQGTRLDKERVQRITTAAVRTEMLDALGERLLHLRGHGGTGKTMMLLTLALELARKRGAPVLVLTFNRCLAATLSHILAQIGGASAQAAQLIRVETFDRYFTALFQCLGIGTEFVDPKDYPGVRQERLERAAKQIAEQGVPKVEYDLSEAQPNWALCYEFLFVDEAQDTIQSEVDLLRSIFPHENIVLADGIGQYVRRKSIGNWTFGLTQAQKHTMYLDSSLRMKSNITRFTQTVAEKLGLADWSTVPRADLGGGRVLIYVGDFFSSRQYFDALVEENRRCTNQLSDMLLCVPRDRIECDGGGNYLRAADAGRLSAWGYHVHDLVEERNRDTVPPGHDFLRVTPYSTCRGLEGWTVINLGLDDLFARRCEEAEAYFTDPASAEQQATARLLAAQWMMIPLTRAVDTLVITLSGAANGQGKPLAQVLLKAAREFEDFCEVCHVA